MNDFKNNILSKIKAGEINMKPQWHFVLKTILLVLGTVVVALVAVYLLSFILFSLHQTGVWFTPSFGMMGIIYFVMSSPWLLITSVIAFLVLLYLLVSRYSFSYQRPLLFSMIGVVVFVLVGSFLIQQTPMHRNLQNFAERNNVPGMRPFYQSMAGERPEGLLLGTISEITDFGFILETDKQEDVEVYVNADTRQRPGTSYVSGETVFVLGQREGDIVKALGVRPADQDLLLSPQQNRRGQELREDNDRVNSELSPKPMFDQDIKR